MLIDPKNGSANPFLSHAHYIVFVGILLVQCLELEGCHVFLGSLSHLGFVSLLARVYYGQVEADAELSLTDRHFAIASLPVVS